MMDDWQAIVSEHGSRLWRAVYRLLLHYDDAMDCCQETLLDAHKFAQRETVVEWGALLTTLGTRRAIDRLRERISQQRFTTSLHDIDEPLSVAEGPIESAEATELIQQLQRAMAELPVKHAEVFWLVSIEGLSHDEVSRQLSISVNESRVLLHRARASLETILQLDKRNVRQS